MISFSFLSKRRGATPAGVFSLALGCVALLCGAGSAPIENLLPQGAMQGDLNAGGHSLTNAATVYATNVVVSGTLTAPSSFTLPFSQLTGTPTSLGGYGIADPVVVTSGSYANPAWMTSLAAGKLTGALPAISGASLTGLTFSQVGGTPTTLAGYGITNGVANGITVNGHALSSNVVISASDLTTGTLPHAQLPVLLSGDIPNNGANTTGNAARDGSGNVITTTYAPLAPPNLTGAPTAPTATVGTNTTQVATTAFVLANAGSVSLGSNQGGALTLSSGVLDFAVAPNAAGGLAQFGSDGTVAWLSPTDTGNNTIAIGAGITGARLGDVLIGGGTSDAGDDAGPGVSIGLNAISDNSGVAIGSNAAQETEESVQLGAGTTFANNSLQVYTDQIATINGSGYATPCAHNDSTTPTNTVTPAGWAKINIDGTTSWIPFYR